MWSAGGGRSFERAVAEYAGGMASKLETAIAEVRAGGVAKVYVYNRDIDDAGATQLADALRTSTSVKVLWLNDNEIGEAGATQ